MRRNAAGCFRISQRENGISCATRFERTALLQVLALEEQLAARLLVERRARQDGSAVDAVADALVRVTDGAEGQAVGRGVHKPAILPCSDRQSMNIGSR